VTQDNNKISYEEQQAREARDRADAVLANQERRKQQMKFGGLSSTNAGQKLKEEAMEGVIAEINNRIHVHDNRAGGAVKDWRKAIRDIPVEELAEISLIVCLDAVGSDWTWNHALGYAGHALHVAGFTAAMRRDRAGKRALAQLENKAKQRCTRYTDRVEYVLREANRRGWQQDRWSKEELETLGSWLIDVAHVGSDLVEVTDVPDDQKTVGEKKWPENRIVLTDKAQDIMDEHNTLLDGLSTKFSPMTFPPTDWPSVLSPYLDPRQSFRVPMVKKVWSHDAQRKIDTKLNDGSMQPCVDALNLIQSVPLEINDYIVSAIRWAGDMNPAAGARWRKLKKYPNLSKVTVPPKPVVKDMEAEGLSREQRRARWKDYNKQKKRKSLRSAGLRLLSQTLDECASLAGYEFYLPHQFDKRGRIYHTSYFGHHNADYIRACFLFARKSEVAGNENFLFLQLANSYGNGVDKRSLDGRLEWVNTQSELIYKAGKDFTTTEAFAFWSSADEPFQFLAACHEYANAAEAAERGEPYYSGLPIALDATQSGIQHYACSMLDERDGKLVNLLPSKSSDAPDDVYEACRVVAQQLIDGDIARWQSYKTFNPESGDTDKIKADKERGEKYLPSALALKALGGLTRKIVKRNVMTWAYSSRQYGMAKQLRNDWLSDYTDEVDDPAHPRTVHPFGEDEGFLASFYIAGRNEDAIRQVVNSADTGMRFFQDVVRVLMRENKHFEFTTPLGFLMHQFYREDLMKVKKDKDGNEVRDAEGKLVFEKDNIRQRVYLSDKVTKKRKSNAKSCMVQFDDKVAKRSERAVAPNVIHAMDATHLMMTVLKCADRGVEDMMVVHDSFATTIGNAKIMSGTVREQLIALYEDYDLYTEIRNQAADLLDNPDNIADLPQPPKKRQLNLHGIIDSQYCFS